MDHPLLLRQLGTRIRQRRKGFGWSQEELAFRAKVNRNYVGGIERGEFNVTFLMLCRFSEALDCDLGDLVAGMPRSAADSFGESKYK